MYKTISRKLTFANVVAMLALLFSMTAGAEAAGLTGFITGKHVVDESLTGADIRNGSIGTADVEGLTHGDVAGFPYEAGDTYLRFAQASGTGFASTTVSCSDPDLLVGGGASTGPFLNLTSSSPSPAVQNGIPQAWAASANAPNVQAQANVTAYVVCLKGTVQP